MGDLIDRQAAIVTAIRAAIDWHKLANPQYSIAYCIGEAIRQLPSAEPEPCDDPRADIYYLAEKIGIHRLYALVVELRGEPEPCKDAVSRQAAIDALSCCQTYLFDSRDYDKKISLEDAAYAIEQLPSVQQEVNPADIDYYYCSNAMLKMWIDNVLTDGEYNKIMDKLNDFERRRKEKENG